MRRITTRINGLALMTGLFTIVAVSGLQAQGQSSAGVVRISDKTTRRSQLPQGTVQPVSYTHYAQKTIFTNSASGLVHEGPAIRLTGNRLTDWFTIRRIKMRARRARIWMNLQQAGGSDYNNNSCSYQNKASLRGRHLSAWSRCQFGYFYPTGCCGTGCPLVGTYDMVYAVDPYYHDQRDGRLYSAAGTGVPMTVPLAPNVRHTYNYGWGIPSSRLTPIFRAAPPVQYINPQ